MQETWRWFGPNDNISLQDIRQTGATGVVTALHDVAPGVAWTQDAITERSEMIKAAGLEWSVCESIPVPDAIKRDGASAAAQIDAWKTSLERLGGAGVRTVCYNFMPVVDWTRTDLVFKLNDGGFALRYDHIDFVAYDVFILGRSGAADDYAAEDVEMAEKRFHKLDEIGQLALEKNIISGLPGGADGHSRGAILTLIDSFKGMSKDDMRANLSHFLKEVLPVAQEFGVKLAIHPDDPPLPLFGLPRIVSNADDARFILGCHDVPENGLTFCTGSYGARGENDLSAMAQEFAQRTNFAHLRMVRLEGNHCFHEAEHLHRLDEMAAVARALSRAERLSGSEIPMRPDHGHLLATDATRASNPGYSYIGRLKGLAEIRGLIAGLNLSEGASS